ncbi:PH domain-containing protein [Niallia sp. BSM11]|uniref:PH domain-containing protein n=1 Tax=Niallia sp. BSM11 TaxID=3391576 RepID=UPI003985296F
MGKKSKHISYIESLLSDGETVLQAHECFKEGVMGAIVLTDTRLIFGSNGFFTGESIDELKYDRLVSAEFINKFADPSLNIYVKNSQQVIKINGSSSEYLNKTRSIITKKIEEYNKEVITEDKPSYSIADELLKIAELKEKGHLTDTEFELLKAKIINQ